MKLTLPSFAEQERKGSTTHYSNTRKREKQKSGRRKRKRMRRGMRQERKEGLEKRWKEKEKKERKFDSEASFKLIFVAIIQNYSLMQCSSLGVTRVNFLIPLLPPSFLFPIPTEISTKVNTFSSFLRSFQFTLAILSKSSAKCILCGKNLKFIINNLNS